MSDEVLKVSSPDTALNATLWAENERLKKELAERDKADLNARVDELHDAAEARFEEFDARLSVLEGSPKAPADDTKGAKNGKPAPKPTAPVTTPAPKRRAWL